MVEFVLLNDDEQELWEIDYEKKIALNISDLGVIKDKVSNYAGTIKDFLKEKGFSEVHFHENGSLPSRAHYTGKRNCSDGFGHNDEDQCIPIGDCPSGYGRSDDDETGRWVLGRDLKDCPGGERIHKDWECPITIPTDEFGNPKWSDVTFGFSNAFQSPLMVF